MYRYLLCSIDTRIETLRIVIQRCITVLSHLYWINLGTRFNSNALNFIREEYRVDTLPPWKRYVCMYILGE